MKPDPDLIPFLDIFCEAVLVDFAHADVDEVVPIGRLYVEMFQADEKGYYYPPAFLEVYMTVGEIRDSMRRAREEMLS